MKRYPVGQSFGIDMGTEVIHTFMTTRCTTTTQLWVPSTPNNPYISGPGYWHLLKIDFWLWMMS